MPILYLMIYCLLHCYSCWSISLIILHNYIAFLECWFLKLRLTHVAHFWLDGLVGELEKKDVWSL